MKKGTTFVKVAAIIMCCMLALSGCGKEDELLQQESNEVNVELETAAPKVTEEPAEATEAPTAEPTAEPTEEPEATKEPTEEPTKEPEVTEEPTEEPTKEPEVTAAPKATDKPVETQVPKTTEAPTAEPTKAPVVTQAPKVTEAPTQAPTQAPVVTAAPTTAPTQAPVVTEAPVVEHTHTWDGGTVSIAATCSTSGEMKYTCSGCSETKTETIAPNGEHEKVDVWELGQVPDCTHRGALITKCANCKEVFARTEYPTAEHNWEMTQTFAGSCKTPAEYSRVCKDCGFEGTTVYGDLNPDVHDWKEYTGEVWNEETWVWETITEVSCSDCRKIKE